MAFFVDGTPMESFGVIVERVSGHLAPAVDPPPGVAVPGRFGRRVTGAPAAVPPRRITVTATLRVVAVADIEPVLDALVALCAGHAGGPSGGAVTLAVTNARPGVAPTRQWTGYFSGATEVDRYAPQETSRWLRLALAFDCLDPLAYDATLSTLTAALGVACPVGTARSAPLVTINEPFAGASRTISQYTGASVLVRSCTITAPGGSMIAGDYVEVDTAAATVTHVRPGTSTRTLVPSWLTAGDFVWIDPADVVGGAAPILGVDAGTITIAYRRAWR